MAQTAKEILDKYIPKQIRLVSDDDELIVEYGDALAAMEEYHAQFNTPSPVDPEHPKY